jgi:predicted nucleic acid-binding Zn ribbon protein
VGVQVGEHCVVCGEAQPMVTYTYPDGRVIRLHTACDNLWHEERARP